MHWLPRPFFFCLPMRFRQALPTGESLRDLLGLPVGKALLYAESLLQHWCANVRCLLTSDAPVSSPCFFDWDVMIGKTPAPKVRATLYLSADVLDEARNAAVHLAGYPAHLTLTKLAENALRAELHRLKLLYNGGRDFPRRSEDLKGGRPIAA